MMRAISISSLILSILLVVTISRHAVAADREVVRRVEINVEGEYDAEDVYSAISPLLEKPFSEYQIRKAVESIYGLAHFSQVEVEKSIISDGVKLTFKLYLKEIIEKLEITGNDNISKTRIIAAIKSRYHSEFAEEIVEQDIRRIRKLYEKEGFYKVRVNYRAEKIGSRERALSFEIDEGERARIGQILFVGNKVFQDDRLIRESKLREGSVYSDSVLRAGLERIENLYVKEGYLTAKARKLRDAYFPMINQINLQIEIDEGPKVIVQFEGNDSISDRKIKDSILLFRLRDISDFVMARSVVDIEALYKRNGFFRATARYEAKKVSPQEMLIKFIISEGERFKIEEIVITGNEAFSDDELKKQISTRESGWGIPFIGGKRGIYEEEQFRIDMKALEIFYRKNGYLDVHVGEPEINVEGNRLRILISVDEGQRSWVRKIDFSGNRALRSEYLADGLHTHEGDSINEETLIQDKALIRAKYAEAGYIYAQVEPKYDRTSSTVTFHIKEGKRAKLNSVSVIGNEKTDPSVVIREIPLKPGEYLNPMKLGDARLALFRLGLFKSIKFTFDGAEQERENLDLIVELIERNSGAINLSGGYSRPEGFRTTFEFINRNLFGKARRLTAKLRIGTLGNRYEVQYQEPWLLGTRTKMNARLYREDLEDQEEGIATGLVTGLTRKISRINDVSLQYHYQVLSLPDLRTTIGSIGAVFQRDTRDSFLDPARGWLNEISAEYAGRYLLSENSFLKITGALRNYRPLIASDDYGYRVALAWALRTGFTRAFQEARRFVAFEKFKSGGADSIRGYEPERTEITGEGIRDMMLICNVECRTWLFKSIGASVFLDMGNTWDSFSEITPKSVRISIGAGLRYNTPIGPVRLDYGYPIDSSAKPDKKGQLWFSFKNAF